MSEENAFSAAAHQEPGAQPQLFTCPECARAGIHTVFADARGRGTHRRIKHGVMGTSSAAVAYREKRAQIAKATRRTARPGAKPGARPVGRPRGSVTKNPAPGRGHAAGSIVPVAAGSAAQMSQALLGYAVGRLVGMAERIARENDLPETEFTRRAAALFAELSAR